MLLKDAYTMTTGVPELELIPAIDLKGGRCVRLQEGIASRSTEYSDDPVSMALHWEDQGATRLHLVDLDGAFSGRSAHLEIARSIFRSAKIPVQFGGGLRTIEQVEAILDLGAERAILGTAAVDNPEVVEEAVRRHPESIIVGIDARQGNVMLRGWIKKTAVPAIDLARRMKNAGVRRACGIEGVILGRALYDRKIDFADLCKQMLSWRSGE
jgi:phosphoribosylformimino-5-aminoimidazole carboxamide ribotide isomerase